MKTNSNDQIFATREEMLELHQLQMLSTASLYQLWGGKGRAASAKALVDFFFGVVRISAPDLFLECGAKKAEASLRAREILPNSRIVAFEASPENYAAYSKTRGFEENNIEYRHQALNDHVGTVTFNIRRKMNGEPINHTGANSILLRTADNVEYDHYTVPCTALDNEFKDDATAAMWIDVEGASQQVISGGLNTLSKATTVLIEVEDYAVWEGQWTTDIVVAKFYELGLIPVARDFEYNGQYNILFIRDTVLKNREVRRNIEYFYSVLAKK